MSEDRWPDHLSSLPSGLGCMRREVYRHRSGNVEAVKVVARAIVEALDIEAGVGKGNLLGPSRDCPGTIQGPSRDHPESMQ